MASIDRALGAVIGSAVGDALGAPFEFGPAGEYSRRFPEPARGAGGEMQGGGSLGWAPGEFTDDTQMAVLQALCLLEHRGFDGEDLFRRFRVWASTARDVGISTRSVLASALAWDAAAAAYFEANPDGSAGNGGLMRATPSAVYAARRDVEFSMRLARELASVTHGDPAAQWGAAIHHAVVRSLLLGSPWSDAVDAARVLVPADQARFAELLDLRWTPDDTHLPNGTVWTCLAQAVWAVRSTTSFESAVVAAIDLGGDTDTVAAVAGGLAGASYGVDSIPARWLTNLHGWIPGFDEPWRLDDLTRLTHALMS